MPENNKKFYITSSIVYTNASPHIGFALEVIQADVIARYHRLLGEDILFLTGTDEHGAKIAKAAKEEGKTPEKFTEEIAKKAEDLKETLNLSNDDFIRTTDQKRHWPGVEKVWLRLKENGDIYKKKYRGFYCLGCEAFVTEKDLVDGKCPIHKETPEIVEEENYFFRLSKYSKQVEKAIEDNEIKIIPEARKNEILSFIRGGVEDVSISRARDKLKWGIPVPDDDSQTVYVWLEALINYISALDYQKDGEKFGRYWPADVHCVGKDIFRFHILLWPAMLFSLGLALPKTEFVHGFITVSGQKMSKSLGNVIDPFSLVEKYGTDPVRYFLLREILPTEDGDFTYEKFEGRYNSDLASGLGNLVARVLTMAKGKNYESGIMNQEFKNEIEKTWENYKTSLDDFKFNEALSLIWQLIGFCDKYIERERPWEKSDNQLSVINNLLITLAHVASLLQPFLPETSEKIFNQLGIKPTDKKWKFKIKKAKALFPRLK